MGRKKKDKFDDAAFIAHLEETLPQEEKDSPLFLAYKASVKPKKERTSKERINLKMFELAFSVLPLLSLDKKTNTIGFADEADAKSILDIMKSATDKLHSELEKTTGRKLPKPFLGKAEPELNAKFDEVYPEMLKKWEDRKK